MAKTNHGLVVALLCHLTACGGQENDTGASARTSADNIAATEAVAPSSDNAKYDKSMGKKGCEMLTPAMVAGLFGAPQDALRQIKVAGCVYSWKADDRVVEARISLPMVHKSEQSAVQWFANATRDVTAAEAQQQVDQAMGKVKDKAADGELGPRVTKSAVNTVQAAMAEVEAQGARHADMAGVGDAARVNLDDGGIWVRVNNLTFSVAGYGGPPQPRMAHKTINIKQIVAESQAANRAWIQQTLDQRKRDSEKLARAIVGNL